MRPQLSGSLNIYSKQPGGLDDVSRTAALLPATHASPALARTVAVETAEPRTDRLRRAINSRDVIGAPATPSSTDAGTDAAEPLAAALTTAARRA